MLLSAKIENAQQPTCLYYREGDTICRHITWRQARYGLWLHVNKYEPNRLEYDSEKVRYLSKEERLNYLVKIDKEGRLVWAKNGARIDTTEKYKDNIHGIVPATDPTLHMWSQMPKQQLACKVMTWVRMRHQTLLRRRHFLSLLSLLSLLSRKFWYHRGTCLTFSAKYHITDSLILVS